jgi:hypothetical protein
VEVVAQRYLPYFLGGTLKDGREKKKKETLRKDGKGIKKGKDGHQGKS